MIATVYNSSSGPKDIAAMNYHNVRAAHAKLIRDERFDRQDEIDGLASRLAELEAEQGDNPTPPVAAIGHNNPPEPTPIVKPVAPNADPFEAIRVRIEDLSLKAKNWAGGVEIANEAQAAEVDRLIDDIKDAIKVAEAIRDKQIEPLTAQVTAIRESFYPLIGDTKKVTGSAIRTKTALLAVKTAWGSKARAIQMAEAERLRKIAADAAREAAAAHQAAAGNLEAAESAEDLIKAAQGALRTAKAAEKATPGAGYRTEWVTTIADPLTAIRSMWKRFPDEFTTLALSLARREVREGKRVIEGFTITETKVAV